MLTVPIDIVFWPWQQRRPGRLFYGNSVKRFKKVIRIGFQVHRAARRRDSANQTTRKGPNCHPIFFLDKRRKPFVVKICQMA
jgi:hypothetical protein